MGEEEKKEDYLKLRPWTGTGRRSDTSKLPITHHKRSVEMGKLRDMLVGTEMELERERREKEDLKIILETYMRGMGERGEV